MEVLVSLALASIIFVIAAAVWLQVAGPLSSHRQLDIRLQARKLIQNATDAQATNDATFSAEGLTFIRRVRPINPRTGLYQIDITLQSTEAGTPTFHRSKIVRYDEAARIHTH